LATALSGNDKEVEALEEYKRAVALGPRNPTFVEHLAVSLALNGDTNGAVDQLQKAIAIEPNSVEYRFNLGYMLESQGDFAGAVSSFEKAVQLSRGKDWRCLAELAKVYDKVGRSAEAVRSAELALDLAVKQNNVQVAQNLRDALKQYERRGGVGQSQ
jgi:Flp pilus assembly protein TadD